MTNDVARIELKRVIFDATPRQYDCRIERTQSTGGSVGNEMNVGKPLWIAAQISLRSRLPSGEDLLLLRRKMFSNAFHLNGSLRDLGIFIVGGDTIANQKQASVVFLPHSVRSVQDSQRAGIRDAYIFNPVV